MYLKLTKTALVEVPIWLTFATIFSCTSRRANL